MKQNPQISYFDDKYAIRFIKSNYKVLLWIQDLSEKKFKSEIVNRPIVFFNTKQEAEQEIRNIAIPYLLNNKMIDSSYIVGW